jgi:hypothetical protein
VGKKSLLRRQDPLKGGIRAGRSLATGEALVIEKLTIQMKMALGQLPSA